MNTIPGTSIVDYCESVCTYIQFKETYFSINTFLKQLKTFMCLFFLLFFRSPLMPWIQKILRILHMTITWLTFITILGMYRYYGHRHVIKHIMKLDITGLVSPCNDDIADRQTSYITLLTSCSLPSLWHDCHTRYLVLYNNVTWYQCTASFNKEKMCHDTITYLSSNRSCPCEYKHHWNSEVNWLKCQ